MSQRTRTATATLLFVICAACHGKVAAQPASTLRHLHVAGDEFHDLRSAFLIDAGFVSYSPAQPLGVQLKRHFEVVIAILEANGESSLRRILGELFTTTKDGFSSKAQCLGWLRDRRLRQIEELRRYAEQGRFPHNHRFLNPVPVFVDSSNVACAVGHLLLQSGES